MDPCRDYGHQLEFLEGEVYKMIEILCDECNNYMNIEEEKTLQTYSRELGYTVVTGGEIDLSTLQDYMVYRCSHCKVLKKYTLKDVEFQFRRSIAKEALRTRMIYNMRALPDEARNYDSEMFYCGKCVGIDPEEQNGYCLKSVAKHCRILKGLKL